MHVFWFFVLFCVKRPNVNTEILARKFKRYKSENCSKILVPHFIQSHLSLSDVTLVRRKLPRKFSGYSVSDTVRIGTLSLSYFKYLLSGRTVRGQKVRSVQICSTVFFGFISTLFDFLDFLFGSTNFRNDCINQAEDVSNLF